MKFITADILNLPFDKDQFDHCFFCFVLEHFPVPLKILQLASKVVRSEGSIRAIECNLGGAVFVPSKKDIKAIISGAVQCHTQCGGTPYMGSRIEITMKQAKLRDVNAEKIEIDTQDPVNGMHALKVLEKIVIPVYKGMKKQMIDAGYIKGENYCAGMKQLETIIKKCGTNYTDAVYFAEGKPYKASFTDPL